MADAAAGTDPSRVRPWPRRWRWPLSLLLALSTGVAYGLHVLDNRLAALAYLSTLPWLMLCIHPRLRGRFNYLSLGLGLHLLILIGIYWLRGQSTGAWLIAPIWYWPVFLLSLPLCAAVVTRWPRFPPTLLWPLVFTGLEWLRIRTCPGELSLYHLAYSQIRHSRLIQVADIGGTAMISFYLTAVTGLVGALILSRSLFSTSAERRRWLLPQAAFVAVLALSINVYGAFRDTERHFYEGPTLQVVQTNTPRTRDPDEVRRILDHQILQTLSTMRPGRIDAILWPENSLITPIRDGENWDEALLTDLRRLTERARAPLFFDSGWVTAGGLNYHAAYLLGLDGSLQHHWKVRLLPWTEFAPLRGFFGLFGEGVLSWWLSLIERFVGFLPVGAEAPLSAIHAMELKGRDGRVYRFGAPICFEIATARVVNRWHREGVDFLVNPASEGRLGDTVHYQTIAISGFRAIEGRVPVVRVTNDGISGLIDANGRPRELLTGRHSGALINESGVLIATVPLDSRGPTLYARFGDWFAIGCLVLAALLGLAAHVPARRD